MIKTTPGYVCRCRICKWGDCCWCFFFFWWRSNYSKWLRVVFPPSCTPPSGLSITSPPLAPLTILHPPPHPTPLHPTHRHRVSAAITYRITSRRKVDFPTGHLSEAITAGGQDEVKWHDLWERWKGRGHKCIANLRDVPVEAAGPERLAWLWRRCWNRARPSAPWSDYIYTRGVKQGPFLH